MRIVSADCSRVEVPKTAAHLASSSQNMTDYPNIVGSMPKSDAIIGEILNSWINYNVQRNMGYGLLWL